MIIVTVDVPLSPSPHFMMINESTIRVNWERPFTWDDFPITHYTVEVLNQTGDMLNSSVISPPELYYSITQMSPPSCTNLTFLVQAVNSVGPSPPGTTHGAFPSSKLALNTKH